MLALTRIQLSLQRLSPTCHISLSSYRLFPRPARTRALAMAHPIASSSHPAQIPALDSPHASSDPAAKKSKDSKKPKVAPTGHPLEVRLEHCWNFFHLTTNLDQLQPAPEFFDHRLKIFNELKAEYDTFVAGTK